MDFWNWLWVLAFPAMLIGGWLIITRMGRTALSRYLSEKEEPVETDPWGTWKKLAAETRKRKEAEKAEWQKSFRELLRATCTHEYDDQEYKQGWWRCVLCGYQKPWEWGEGCSCGFQEDKTLTDVHSRKVLFHRSGNCCLHGMPRLIAYNKRAQ